MYAMAIVADRDTPAWQCTSTLAPLFRASSETAVHKRHKHVYLALKVTGYSYTCVTMMSWAYSSIREATSNTYTILTVNIAGLLSPQ
jgi:hypothetical protein